LFVDTGLEGIELSLAFLLIPPIHFRRQPIPIEQIKLLLQLPPLHIVEIELFLLIGLLTLLEVDGVDMVDPYNSQHEHTDISGVDFDFVQ
jgi:hypothetical protein